VTTPLRGHVYRADVGFGSKPWLVVSNNQRNHRLSDVLAVRLTTTVKELPTWVALGRADPLGGYVNADNIETLGRDELGDYLGAVTPATLSTVDRALCAALGIQLAH
jgi:mRNA interferase MazF